MFKYLPNCPPQLDRRGTAKGTMIAILVSMFLNDIPFVIIRCITLINFDGRTSDIIYPLKNAAMVIFGCIQIRAIRRNLRSHKKTGEIVVRISRKSKFPGAWCEESEEEMKTMTLEDENEKRMSTLSHMHMPTDVEMETEPETVSNSSEVTELEDKDAK